MSIRKRTVGPKNGKRKAWVLDYYDQAGKRRHKSFKRKRDAEEFAKTTRLLGEGNAFADGDQSDYTIHQGRLYGLTPETPLTVRAIVHRIGRIWRANTFLTDFASEADPNGRALFIEDRFLGDAIEGGKTLETYTYRMPDVDEDAGWVDEDAGWVGLHRFFGMYVVNSTQYGEGQDDFGPFANIKDGKAVFDAVISLYVPPDAKRVR
jgi:hypothetical protein